MGFALSNMTLTSTAFPDGGPIPKKHSGEGQDVSPALSWGDAPAGTKAFAIICHDPDAPLVSKNGTYGFVHWVLYNIPGSVSSLAEGDGGYTSGRNDFGKSGYLGPMPPNGHGRHHYYFWVLALNDDSPIEAGLNMWKLLEATESRLVGMNRLVGVYQRV
jgi:Raf kinase inhibitor-like YbhB/YbcL family protein